MGAVKTLLITGAGGYLGRHTVDQARRRGHIVRALVRRHESIPTAWGNDAKIIPVVLDMGSAQTNFSAALNGIDGVIHLAASLEGDDVTHARDTVFATYQLYRAIAAHPVPVVLASSIAAYQGCAGLVDEDTLLEPQPEARDAYTRAKLDQDTIAMQAVEQGISTRILRLGAVFGPDRMWNAHIGVRAGGLLVLLAGRGEIPLVFAPHAAQALVLASETPLPDATTEALNIVDDALPDARGYLAALRASDFAPHYAPIIVPFPWQILMVLARIARCLGVSAPGLLRPVTLAARMAPRSYSNARAKAALGWAPNTNLKTALSAGGPA